MTAPSFEDEILAMARDAAPPQYPLTRYDRDGDCVEVLVLPDSFVAHRIDHLLTIYLTRGPEPRFVGCTIKGVKRLVEQVLTEAPGFKNDMEGTRIRLEWLLTARIWSLGDDVAHDRVRAYKDAREQVGNEEADVALC